MQKKQKKAIITYMTETDEKDRLARARIGMVQYQIRGRGITDLQVLNAMAQIPREIFVTQPNINQAYEDRPLPIGMDQTISQPYIVALMTELLCLDKNCEVLEIGTGSGYQTAILAYLAKKVYTIERLPQLLSIAQTTLKSLNVDNVEFLVGDGSIGWSPHRHFDRVIVTAAVPSEPAVLLRQLKKNGILVAPVGGVFSQELMAYTRTENRITQKAVCGCRFVKLIGEQGFEERSPTDD
ncbi:MAG: protein-L-isoaspartate(D-aspartate) O-methyltransferase [Planctomycetota bacterium]